MENRSIGITVLSPEARPAVILPSICHCSFPKGSHCRSARRIEREVQSGAVADRLLALENVHNRGLVVVFEAQAEELVRGSVLRQGDTDRGQGRNLVILGARVRGDAE